MVMTSCLNVDFVNARHPHKYIGELVSNASTSPSIPSMMSKRWRKRLQIRCRNRHPMATTLVDSSSLRFERYIMLGDDDDDDECSEEDASGAHEEKNQNIDNEGEIICIPQWEVPTIGPQFDIPNDTNSSSDDEGTEDEVSNKIVATTDALTTTSAFPIASMHVSDISTITLSPPSISIEEVEEMCGIYFLRKGGKIRVRRYSRPKKSTVKASMSDSETEEDSSSTSSILDDAEKTSTTGSNTSSIVTPTTNSNTDTSFAIDESIQKHRRSIRFSDEVYGQSLTTIHLVPWSEHNDPEWIPRPVRCRMEL